MSETCAEAEEGFWFVLRALKALDGGVKAFVSDTSCLGVRLTAGRLTGVETWNRKRKKCLEHFVFKFTKQLLFTNECKYKTSI